MTENETEAEAMAEAITISRDFKVSASEQALSSCCGALLTSLCGMFLYGNFCHKNCVILQLHPLTL